MTKRTKITFKNDKDGIDISVTYGEEYYQTLSECFLFSLRELRKDSTPKQLENIAKHLEGLAAEVRDESQKNRTS